MAHKSETREMTPEAKRAWRLVKRYSCDGPYPRVDLFHAALSRFNRAGGFHGAVRKRKPGEGR